MGPPSNYPDFKGLVKKIARGTSYRRAMNEPIDHFFGRLESKGIKVHDLTKTFLTDPKSRPNPLHLSIVRLFDSKHTLRLVTTNFDAHFSTEIEKHFETNIETYNAPALPVGSRFEGLVYIHGSVDGPSERLVLTDGDFGRAYLTEGWARRFLQEVYSRFTVLFIGYSHNDTVMQYLTRGLSPDSAKLFALTPEGSIEHWRFLGINPIHYTLGKTGDRHRALCEAMEAWAETASMGAFEHEQRIKNLLVAAPPLVKTEEDDYLQSVVNNEEQIHFFVRNASGQEWLLWAEERDLLSPLFSRRKDIDKPIGELATWFAKEFVLNCSEIALGVFERHGQMMSQALWYEIARNFFTSESQDANSLSKWLPILIDQATSEENVELIEYLFTKAAKTGSWPLVLRLFEHLTRPRILLRESISFFEGGRRDATPTSSEIRIPGSHYRLKEALIELLNPNLPDLAEDLVRVAAYNIRLAHDLGRIHRISSELESLSYQRSAIEPHEQNQLDHDFDVVIDACRDALEWLLDHKRKVATRMIEEWVSSPAPLLRRLAVHGMKVDKRKSADNKIKWVTKHELVASIAVHHELFQLLRYCYPWAGITAKKAFLDQSRTVTRRKIREHPDDDPDIFWRGLLQLLSWLDEVSQGKCPMARGRRRRLGRRYPSFRVLDNPDFTHWSSGVRDGWESPSSAEDLREKPIKEAVSFLLTLKGKLISGPNRAGLLRDFSAAAKQDPDWGLRMAEELRKRRTSSDDVWRSFFWGCSEADLTKNQWKTILNMVDRNPKLLKYEHAVTKLLERGIRKEKFRLPDSLLPVAERIGSQLWNVAVRKKKPAERDSKEWLHTAINETGGNLAEFFMMAISLRRKRLGIRWSGIPKKLKTQLRKIVSGRSYTAEMGRVLLASQVHFLFSSDPTWTRKNVIPLLSWQISNRQAVQAWHGYLFWGKWLDELLPDFLPLYAQGFTRLSTDLVHVRQRFVEHIAAICVFSTRQKPRGTWLNQFLRSIELTDRIEFAASVKKILWGLDPDKAAHVWRKWLDTYWESRLVGKPVPLGEQEVSKMAEWAPHLGPVFPQVVKRIRETGLKLSVDSYFYHILNDNDIPATHPKATADLLVCLVTSSYDPMHDYGDLDKVIDKLIGCPETHESLKRVVDHMAAKGSLIAGKHMERLNGPTGT